MSLPEGTAENLRALTVASICMSLSKPLILAWQRGTGLCSEMWNSGFLHRAGLWCRSPQTLKKSCSSSNCWSSSFIQKGSNLEDRTRSYHAPQSTYFHSLSKGHQRVPLLQQETWEAFQTPPTPSHLTSEFTLFFCRSILEICSFFLSPLPL